MIFGTLAAKTDDPNICSDIKKAKAAYDRDGYLIYDFGFSEKLLTRVSRVTQSMAGDYARIQDMWRIDEAVKMLGASAEVLDLLMALYGRRAFPFQTLNFCVGTQQETHADSLHFSSSPENFMCGVWVALEDIDMENGPLHYFRGSHKRPIATLADIKGQQDEIPRFFAKAAAPYKKEYGLIKRGQAVIWAANLLHGGDPIKDKNRSRLSQVTHYYFEDCLYTNPLKVKPDGGEYLRHPYDFSQGKFIYGRKNGKRTFPHIRSFLGAHANKLMRRTIPFK